jgi:hypothetical protein
VTASSISIDSLGVGVPVEHPRRKGRADTESVLVQVHGNALWLWCEGCQLGSEIYHFATPADRRLGRGLAELLDHIGELAAAAHRAGQEAQ